MKLVRRKRGVSGIISGIFLVAVTVMIFGAMVSQYSLFENYNSAVQRAEQRAWERYNERLVIVGVTANSSYLNFTVTNCGSVTAHIVDVFLRFVNGTNKLYTIDVWIAPGSSKQIVAYNIRLGLNDKYDFQIATERGNLISPTPVNQAGSQYYYYYNGGYYYYNNPGGTTPGGYQPMPFIFGFGYNDFQYSTASASGPWSPAWIMPKGSRPWFRVLLNNTYSKDIVLQGTHTRLVFYQDDQWQPRQAVTLVNTPISAKSGVYVYFDRIPNQFPNTANQHLYAMIEAFYYFTDNPSQVMGTTVTILAVYLT